MLKSLKLPPSLRILCFWLTTRFLRTLRRSSFLSLERFIGPLPGVSCSSLISIALSLTCLGRLPMVSSTLPSVWPLLVMICPLPVSAVTIWSLWTIFSFIVRWLLVFFLGFNCYFFMPLLWPLLSCVAMRFLVSLFVYAINVGKFYIWLARNDFRFRDAPPSAIDVIESIKCRITFHLPLFFRRFRSPRQRRYFVCQWGARGTIASISDGNLSVHF